MKFLAEFPHEPSASVQFPQIKLLTIEEVASGWAKAEKTHFDDGDIFDQIYLK